MKKVFFFFFFSVECVIRSDLSEWEVSFNAFFFLFLHAEEGKEGYYRSVVISVVVFF